jgi:hypothetical protein
MLATSRICKVWQTLPSFSLQAKELNRMYNQS